MSKTTACALAVMLVCGAVLGDGASEHVELERGASGKAITALVGVDLVEIPLRYIGLFKDFAGPGLDLHLVELEGPVADEVGVAAGMSGSPVYVGDRLIGALSYRLGRLPKKAIAGVTPLSDVLESSRVSGPAPGASSSGMTPIATPVVASGLDATLRDWLAPRFVEQGLVLAAGGQIGAGADSDSDELRPGSPVAVELVRGDIRMAATGTVTYVDGDRVYAFGHPFLGAGRVRLPMATAEVLYTLADLSGSTKLASIGREIGAVVEDRQAAIVGTLGEKVAMIPVTVRVRGGDYAERTFSYEVADQSSLAPLLSAVVVANSLRQNLGFDEASTMLAQGSLRLAGLPEVPIELAFAGRGGADPGLALANDIFAKLVRVWSNPWDEAVIEGLDLQVEVWPEIRRYRVESVHYDRGALSPGEMLQIECVLRRYRGDRITQTLQVELPDELPSSGSLILAVGSPNGVDRAMGSPLGERIRSAPDLRAMVAALGDQRSNNFLTAVVYRGGGGLVTRGEAYADLPPTVARLLATQSPPRSRSRANVVALGQTELELDGPVQGGVQMRLRIERIPEPGETR